MKKLINRGICATLTLSFCVGFCSCTQNKPEENDYVTVKNVLGTQVGTLSDCDYYIVPEPAASTKVSAIESLKIVGDVQKIYASSSGYVQAVVVAKNNLIDTNSQFITEFINSLIQNSAWLKDENTSSTDIVNAVTKYLPKDSIPTFNAKNLTKQVISNCNAYFASADECKEQMISFVNKLSEISGQNFGTPSENFFYTPKTTQTSQTTTASSVSVYAPDGAPALSIASLLYADTKAEGGSEIAGCKMNYNVIDASTVQMYVSGASPKADVFILPSNLAVKLLGSGEQYKLLGSVTHGNLYVLSNTQTQEITVENLHSLCGKTVGVVNLPQIPGLTFKAILADNGIKFKEE